MNRLPSIKTLSTIFGDNAKKARAILELKSTAGQLSEFKSVQDARKLAYNALSRRHVKLLALSELGEFYGPEAIETEDGEEWADYLNAGDTYTPTLIFWRGNWRVQDLGSFLESSRVKFK